MNFLRPTPLKAVSAPVQNDPNLICDRRFIDQLNEVQGLKQFLFEEKVKFEPSQFDSIDLGLLNNLRFAPEGRPPTNEEWKLLDQKISILASYLNDELRQKIRIRELSRYFGIVPLSFLIAVLGTLFYRFLYSGFLAENSLLFQASFLLTNIVWTVAQGGLGACAFLGTRLATRRAENARIENIGDVADITDKSILKIRIILGCLFGAVVGIPIATPALDAMYSALYSTPGFKLSPSDFGLMVLPFMVGFSTNLVLAIVERCIDSIRTFFGITTK